MSSDANASPQDAALDRLRATAPGWTVWKGAATGSWWAAPPPGHLRSALLNAATAEELERALREAAPG